MCENLSANSVVVYCLKQQKIIKIHIEIKTNSMYNKKIIATILLYLAQITSQTIIYSPQITKRIQYHRKKKKMNQKNNNVYLDLLQ